MLLLPGIIILADYDKIQSIQKIQFYLTMNLFFLIFPQIMVQFWTDYTVQHSISDEISMLYFLPNFQGQNQLFSCYSCYHIRYWTCTYTAGTTVLLTSMRLRTKLNSCVWGQLFHRLLDLIISVPAKDTHNIKMVIL